MLMTLILKQIKLVSLYKKAIDAYKGELNLITDDNMLIEAIGAKIKLVDCGKDNIKITEPRDLRLATLILEEREGPLA